MYVEAFMRRAIELSAMALNSTGSEPFGAIIVREGKIVGEGINRSVANHDPTSHGEIEAIRDACQRLDTLDLQGCDLYTNCEPCPLCVAAIEITGISRLYFAASIKETDEVMRELSSGVRIKIDSEKVRVACSTSAYSRGTRTEQHMVDMAVEIISAWVHSRM